MPEWGGGVTRPFKVQLGLAIIGVALVGVFLRAPLARADGGPASVSLSSADDSGFPTVTAVVLVDQAGKPLTSIPAGATTAEENGKPAQVLSVTPAASAKIPLELVLTIDTSGSMAGGTLPQAQAAASGLLKDLGGGDRAAVISFDNQVRVDQASTADLASANAAVASLEAHGNTALYDAVAKSAEVAGQAVNPRRAVVLLTDGQDYGGLSTLTRDQSIASVAASNTIFYVIGVGSDVDSAYLQQLAQTSGGRYFAAAQASDLSAVYSAIEERLRSYFVVTLRSSAPANGASRKLSLTVTLGGTATTASLTYDSKRPSAATATTPTAVPTPGRVVATPAAAASKTSSRGGSAITVAAIVAVIALPLIALFLLIVGIRRGKRAQVVPPQPPVPGAPLMLSRILPGEQPQYQLVASQDGLSRSYSLAKTLSVGSAPDDDIVFSGGGVAPHQARIWLRDDKVMVHHLVSGYETKVDGQAIEWAQLEPGTVIMIGTGTVRVERASSHLDEAPAIAGSDRIG